MLQPRGEDSLSVTSRVFELVGIARWHGDKVIVVFIVQCVQMPLSTLCAFYVYIPRCVVTDF